MPNEKKAQPRAVANAPWDEPAFFVKAPNIAKTIEASRRLDDLCARAIKEGKTMTDDEPNKLVDFLDEFEREKTALEKRVDDMRPGMQLVFAKGHDNMDKMRGHIQRVADGVRKIEDFNNRMSNSPPSGETK